MKGRITREAEALARKAHQGQVDKAGHDYISHPMRVAGRVAGNDELEAIAWLHDVVEDTGVTLDDLVGIFPARVVAAVDAITRRPGEGSAEYYERVKANPQALQVKFADLADNTDPDRTALLDPGTRDRLAAKYAAAREALSGV